MDCVMKDVTTKSDALPMQLRLPMSDQYYLPCYVRECYGTYYEHVKDLLSGKQFDYIAVTGTPGIGKVFYTYLVSVLPLLL